jgi:aspartate 1-decarboxylase
MQMLRYICRAKIHGGRITGKTLDYEGSLAVGSDLLEAAGIAPWEKVLVVNRNNGARFETYIIEAPPGSGIKLNGPASRLGEVGDEIIVMCFGLVSETELPYLTPRIIQLGPGNRVLTSP